VLGVTFVLEFLVAVDAAELELIQLVDNDTVRLIFHVLLPTVWAIKLLLLFAEAVYAPVTVENAAVGALEVLRKNYEETDGAEEVCCGFLITRLLDV
jgi:hypothetical protein